MSRIHDLALDIESYLYDADEIVDNLEGVLEDMKNLVLNLEHMKNIIDDMDAEYENGSRSSD